MPRTRSSSTNAAPAIDPKNQTIRTCDRCTFVFKAPHPKAGQRCRIRTCKVGPYCWIHLRSQWFLRVKKSKIRNAGLGLFADSPSHGKKAVVFTNQTNTTGLGKGIICVYSKTPVSKQEIDRRHGSGNKTRADYGLHNNGKGAGTYFDPVNSNDNVGRYTNDCRGTEFPCNARVLTKGNTAYIKVQKGHQIKNGEEILWSYGASYWKTR